LAAGAGGPTEVVEVPACPRRAVLVVAGGGVERDAHAAPGLREGASEVGQRAALVLLVAERGDRVGAQPPDQLDGQALVAGENGGPGGRRTGDVAGGDQHAVLRATDGEPGRPAARRRL